VTGTRLEFFALCDLDAWQFAVTESLRQLSGMALLKTLHFGWMPDSTGQDL